MAATPDPDPANPPAPRDAAAEQADREFDGRARAAQAGGTDDLADSPGTSGGTAGTGGDNKVQDELDR